MNNEHQICRDGNSHRFEEFGFSLRVEQKTAKPILKRYLRCCGCGKTKHEKKVLETLTY